MLRRLAIVAASLLGLLVAGELLFRLLPVSTATMVDYHADPDVLTYPPGHAWTISTGWDLRNAQRLHANNWGFASETDYAPDARAIGVVGDSYVEASAIDAAARPAPALQRALDGARPVYGFGSPGTALPDFAQRIRLASEKLDVRDFVVWVGLGNARQAVCGATRAHSRCLDPATLQLRTERQPPPGTGKRILRHSALLQYVFGQLKVDGAALVRATFTRQVPDAAAEPASAAAAAKARLADSPAQRRTLAVIDAAVDSFFAEIGPHRRGRLVMLLDAHHGTGRENEAEREQRAHLMQRLRSHGAEVVDVQQVYAAHRARSPLSLEVGPYDGHLNALGVRLVMESAAATLREQPPRTAATALEPRTNSGQ